MSALGLFERLPPELRQQMYTSLYQECMLHCCCCPQYHKATEEAKTGTVEDYNLLWGYECANKDIDPTLRRGAWSATTMTNAARDSTTWSPFTFLLVSKTIWLEAEPLAWQSLTLSVGLPQLKSLYDKHLQILVRSTEKKRPIFQMIQNLHLTLPNADTLATNISKSSKSHGLSGYFLAGESCQESLRVLKNFSSLAHLSLTVPPPNQMTRWEFRSFWPPLIHYSPDLSWLDVHIAQIDNEHVNFIVGDRTYLDSIEREDENVQHRVLGAMILAAKETLMNKPGSLAKPDVSELSETATFCYEAIEYADVPVTTGRMQSFRNRAVAYLED